jgi:hypothetical protein
VFLYAFDLIELNGDDLRRDPLEVRHGAPRESNILMDLSHDLIKVGHLPAAATVNASVSALAAAA